MSSSTAIAASGTANAGPQRAIDVAFLQGDHALRRLGNADSHTDRIDDPTLARFALQGNERCDLRHHVLKQEFQAEHGAELQRVIVLVRDEEDAVVGDHFKLAQQGIRADDLARHVAAALVELQRQEDQQIGIQHIDALFA